MSSSEAFDLTYKVIVVGDCGTGKTAILDQYTTRKFEDSYAPTIGIDFLTKYVTHGDKKYRLQLWDTAGQDRFRSIVASYYRGTQGAVIVYDVTDRKSFENLPHWVEELKKSIDDPINIVIVGNKCDIEKSRQVSVKDGYEYAASVKAGFVEVSAKNRIFIDEIFMKVVELNGRFVDIHLKKGGCSETMPLKDKSSDKQGVRSGLCCW